MLNLEKRLTVLENKKTELQMEPKIIQQIEDIVQENVTKKVENEQNTWSQVVSKNIMKANKKNTKAEVIQINEEIKIEKNIVFKGVKSDEKNDTIKVEEILQILMPGEKVKFDGLKRIGKKEEGKQQPILITVTDKKQFMTFLRTMNKLRNEDTCRHVYIEKDLTKLEQKEQYDLRCELKERRRNGEQCIINKNRIVNINPGTEQSKEEDDDEEEMKTMEDLLTIT
jgi:hypothetical protein